VAGSVLGQAVYGGKCTRHRMYGGSVLEHPVYGGKCSWTPCEWLKVF